MGYLEKQNAILQKLKDTNYEAFGMPNEEIPLEERKQEALQFMETQLMAFPNYVNVVIHQQVMQPIYYQRFEGQELRDKVTDLDTSRHYAHESAITAANALNRLSNKLGLGPFTMVDTKDRYAVADMAGAYVNEVYNHGIGKTMDDAAFQKTQPYNPRAIKEHVRRLPDISGIASPNNGTEYGT